jgi:hypothetical protein
VTSIQVFAFEVSRFQSSIAPTPFHLAYLLSLPNLLARRIRGTKPLDDYSKSHVVTTIEYLNYAIESYTKRSFRTYHRRQKEKKKKRNERT